MNQHPMPGKDAVNHPDVDPQDRAAIVDALYRFGAGQDLRDRALFESAFSAQAELDITGPARRLGAELPVLQGRQAITDALMASVSRLDTIHTVTNPRITAYNGRRARLVALVEALNLPRGGHGRHLLLKNIYTAELSKRGGDGTMDRLLIENLWLTGDPEVLFPKPAKRTGSAQFSDAAVSVSAPALTIRASLNSERETKMMLTNKVAVIYGAGGAIGGAVARAFAAEGAQVFLTGRARAAVDAVAQEIGEAAESAEVDALDEHAIDRHLQSVMDTAGRIDVSFNAVGIPDNKILGLPLAEMDVRQFALPLATYVTSYFLTARLAARRMVPNKSGVIMTVSALPARMGTPMNGGYGPAQAAKEALTRDLSLEFARHGLRVLCLRPHGIPETNTMKEVFEIKGKPAGMAWEQFTGYLAGTTHPKRVMTLGEVANVAAFAASDKASGLTGTTVNLTMGSLDD